MYSREEPAGSITELIRYLKEEHRPDFVYRGQTKDYGLMLPSVFRKAPLQKAGDFLLLSGERPDSRVDTVRASLIQSIFQKYGNVVGNYLAQQYCAFSGCIDITSHLPVAAFFATMPYPHYLKPVTAEEPGVIYRFDRSLFDTNTRPSGAKEIPFSPQAKKGEYEVYTDRLLVENNAVMPYRVPGDQHYILQSTITRFEDMRPFLEEIEDKDRRAHGSEGGGEPVLFRRPFMQHGGIIQPRYLCHAPKAGEPSQEHFSNIAGVEDIYGRYGMSAFYFRHTGVQPEYRREALWPGMWEDRTFAVLCFILNSVGSQFDMGEGRKMVDLVDIGYPDNPHIGLDDNIEAWGG